MKRGKREGAVFVLLDGGDIWLEKRGGRRFFGGEGEVFDNPPKNLQSFFNQSFKSFHGLKAFLSLKMKQSLVKTRLL